MSKEVLRLFLVAVAAVVIIFGSAGGYMLLVLSIPVGNSLLGYATLLLVFVRFPVRVMYAIKVQLAMMKERDQKRFEAVF